MHTLVKEEVEILHHKRKHITRLRNFDALVRVRHQADEADVRSRAVGVVTLTELVSSTDVLPSVCSVLVASGREDCCLGR